MKKRIRRGNPQKQRYWEEVVRRWEQGGQSVRAYCRAEGVKESAFYFWRRELSRRRKPDAASGSRPSVSRPTAASQLPQRVSPSGRRVASFLPVHVVEGCAMESSHGVEIVLAQGRTVRVRAGFDRQTLADVLAVLEARPC